ncbi:tetratricopeptide repeat protein [Roseibacillus ishigakijimensis]|uniref:Tetratricopeptide repeat protein n=1 Tax=Roseibacillus ishigakijimensis TaxID=454146 RepID=A0A934RQL0_9BACT|nr:hypothetical protein [Roseibacillus ishigakijimensis]MBK1833274.1 hypothetical protein [Roseibacillus ishigakijimensis]
MGSAENQLGVFRASCWVLGLVAFVELAAVGLALGLDRQREALAAAEPVVVEKIVTEYRTLPPQKETVIKEVIREVPAPIPELPEGPPLDYNFEPVADLRLGTPAIADPLVEKQVEDSRKLRIAGDNMRALLKLEDAAKKAPDDANVLYQTAEVYSAMGLYDRAADYYQQVFSLGTIKAGNLYEMAAIKLRDGIEQPEDMAAKFALGRVWVYRDTNYQAGERVILTIPVSAAPGLNKSADELESALNVQVFLYDDLNGEPKLWDSSRSTMETKWVTAPVDWQENGEELLRVTYTIPSQDTGTSHLLGQRKYFGQVVELFYENALIDKVASPRRLAREVEARGEEVHYYPENYIPDDFNFDNPLLPPLPE